MARKPISQKTRFEVFKRDKFTCQYCGKRAPDVVLHCDHIEPVAAGGKGDILNLITACVDCNAGKGARKLTDGSAVEKQQRQLADLEERRQQLEMMLKWRAGLANEGDRKVDALAEEIRVHMGVGLNDFGRKLAKQWLKKYDFTDLLDAVADVAERREIFKDPEAQRVETDRAINQIPKTAGWAKTCRERPQVRRFYYIRGILNRRLSYVNQWECIQLMEKAFVLGIDVDWMEMCAKELTSWTQWREAIEGAIREEGAAQTDGESNG